MSFTMTCQKLIDAWVQTDSRHPATPVDVYASVESDLSIRMRLSVIELSADEPRDWMLKPVRQTRLSARVLNLNSLFAGGRLGDIRDQDYIESAVLPVYIRAINARQPVIDTVETRLVGVRVIYDRIIIPQRHLGKPEWLVVLTHGRFMAKGPAQSINIDRTDEAILANLMEGSSIKEIALVVDLSPRTVEHRLERLKKQFGAKGLPHLTALLVAAGFDRSITYTGD